MTYKLNCDATNLHKLRVFLIKLPEFRKMNGVIWPKALTLTHPTITKKFESIGNLQLPSWADTFTLISCNPLHVRFSSKQRESSDCSWKPIAAKRVNET